MSDITRLLEIMARLRDAEKGCPWDVAQRFETIAPYTVEEAYEVADAIEGGDREALRGELGDLLFQVVFHARMAEEEGAFDFAGVVDAICDKLVRRHPHVFAEPGAPSPRAPSPTWEEHKAAERAETAAGEGRRASALDDLPRGFPALVRAAKLQRRMAGTGFAWRERAGMMGKLEEELEEVRVELAAGDDAAAGRELGDVLFVAANLARECGVDPEAALRATNARVEARFRHLEARLAESGRTSVEATPEEVERLWQEAKAKEA
jgi:ATP diphosphatase